MTTPAAQDRAFFGHPRGLSTLFFTEMWERFSYYGMRALLLLYMTAPLTAGGLGFDTAQGGAIYGLYTSMVYLATHARRVDRRSADRSAARGAVRRHVYRRRALQHGAVVAGHVLSGPVPDRHRHGSSQGQRQRDRRQALRDRRHPPRCGFLDLLHGYQPRRVHRAADLWLPGSADLVALRVRRCRRGHVAWRDPIRAGRQLAG